MLCTIEDWQQYSSRIYRGSIRFKWLIYTLDVGPWPSEQYTFSISATVLVQMRFSISERLPIENAEVVGILQGACAASGCVMQVDYSCIRAILHLARKIN
jgi:hypothetical protein